MRRTTPTLFFCLSTCLMSATAIAADAPAPAANTAALRDYTLRNQSGQAITDAHARTTDGDDQLITAHGPIAAAESQSFNMPATKCINSVTARLKNGRTLSTTKPSDCHAANIVVRADRIDVATSAAKTP